MHDQRLAAAGGHPEGEFGQILRDKGIIHRIARHPPGIPLGDELVELPQQLARSAEVEIQEDFGIQNREILEISQSDRLRPAGIDCRQVQTDVLVVGGQDGRRHL